MKLFRSLLIILPLCLITSYGYPTNWTLGICEINYTDKIGSSLANSIKKSSLLILSRDFQTMNINKSAGNRPNAIEIGKKEKVDFLVYGSVFQKQTNYLLVLQLVDILREEVKITKSYEFEYDVDKIFDVIDNIVLDFKEGVKKVIPKYEEQVAIEYRKRIQAVETEIIIPGSFFTGISANLFSFIDERENLNTLSLMLSFNYFSEVGGIFSKGWFAGIILPEMLSGWIIGKNETLNTTQDYSSAGKIILIYIGTKIFNFFGLGINWKIIEASIVKNNNSLEFNPIESSISPVFNINIEKLKINVCVPYFVLETRRYYKTVEKYFGVDGYIFYEITENFGILGSIRYHSITIKTSYPSYQYGNGINISLGVFRNFKF